MIYDFKVWSERWIYHTANVVPTLSIPRSRAPFSPARHDVLGVRIHATHYAQAVDAIFEAAYARQAFAATALAVHGVMTGASDPEQRARLNSLDLVVPDGQPVRWALNWLYGTRLADRVYGPFLMRAVCERAANEGLRIFFYGSDEKTLGALIASLMRKFPALRIAGHRASRFARATTQQWDEDVAAIRAAAPDLVFCGLGCPRQETWVYEMREYISAPLIAVGAAFPLWAGVKSMAPAWMQQAGLEWFYRLSHEPLRLWHRYLVYNPLFVLGVLRQKFRRTSGLRAFAEKPSALRWS